jgi:hypothetical protein
MKASGQSEAKKIKIQRQVFLFLFLYINALPLLRFRGKNPIIFLGGPERTGNPPKFPFTAPEDLAN